MTISLLFVKECIETLCSSEPNKLELTVARIQEANGHKSSRPNMSQEPPPSWLLMHKGKKVNGKQKQVHNLIRPYNAQECSGIPGPEIPHLSRHRQCCLCARHCHCHCHCAPHLHGELRVEPLPSHHPPPFSIANNASSSGRTVPLALFRTSTSPIL